MEVARFPDIEDLVRVYLSAQLDSSVSLHRPTTVGASHLMVWRGGGTRDRLVDSPTLNIEAWHVRDGRAAALCADAVDHLIALGGNQLDGWQVTRATNPGGVASLPDPRFPESFRYVAMIELRVRGVRR